MLDQAFSPERYQAWRAQFPWTDEQIAAQLERNAVDIEGSSPFLAKIYRYRADVVRRTGRVSKKDIRHVIDVLIATCGLCGRKAHYRTGLEGRCREHRLVPSAGVVNKRLNLEVKSRAFAEDDRNFDRRQQQRESLRNHWRTTRRPKK